MTKSKYQDDGAQGIGIPLGIPGHQVKERRKEVDNQVEEEQYFVTAQVTGYIVQGFFGNVGVPDQQEL